MVTPADVGVRLSVGLGAGVDVGIGVGVGLGVDDGVVLHAPNTTTAEIRTMIQINAMNMCDWTPTLFIVAPR